MPEKIGLTLGKFAPLHRGHQYLIETALAEMDRVIVIIYDCPETTGVPLNVRAGWIRKLYPQVEVIEGWNGPAGMGDTPEIKRQQEDYILCELGIRGITHFYSSEFYGEHMSQALGAVNRQVDPARQIIPISASAVRHSVYAQRAYLHPTVYRDLICNVVFLGAPSTGKTTLAERMAQHYHTVWMPEYGREYWEQHHLNRRLTQDQLLEIAQGHLAGEERLLPQADTYLFTDTNALTTCLFAQYYHGAVDPRLAELTRLALPRYDLVCVCDTDIPYDDSWDRSGEVNRRVMQKQTLAELHTRKIPYIILHGDIETRCRTVSAILNRFQKYQNILSLAPLSA